MPNVNILTVPMIATDHIFLPRVLLDIASKGVNELIDEAIIRNRK